MGAQTAAEHYKAGRAAMNLKPDDAVKEFEKAVALDDRNSEYHLWLGNALGSVAQKASVLRQPFLARRVKSEFERSAQLDPSNIEARDGLIEFYTQAPGIMGGSMAKAHEQAAAIAKISPLRGHFARAKVAGHEKDTVTVEREEAAAVKEFPDSIVAVNTFANFLFSRKRTDEAFATIEAYIARRPGDAAALWSLGRLADITGTHLDRGEQAVRTVLASSGLGTDPNLPPPANAHYRLGGILAKKGEKEQARKEFEKALELNPKLEVARSALIAL